MYREEFNIFGLTSYLFAAENLFHQKTTGASPTASRAVAAGFSRFPVRSEAAVRCELSLVVSPEGVRAALLYSSILTLPSGQLDPATHDFLNRSD